MEVSPVTAAPALPLNAEAFPVLDVDAFLARLPAEARARVIWAKAPIETGLRRLRTEPLTEALVHEVTTATKAAVVALTSVAASGLAATPDALRALAMTDLRDDEARLISFVRDDESRDTARWVFGLLRSFFETMYTLAPPRLFDQVTSDELRSELTHDPALGAFLGGLVTAMAALEEQKAHGDPGRVEELIDVAFLLLTEFRSAARKLGLWFAPFPAATVQERRGQFLHYATTLGEALTSSDWTVMDDARARNLR
jgi:hypothetical protein